MEALPAVSLTSTKYNPLDVAPWRTQWMPSPRGWTVKFDETDSPRLHAPVRLDAGPPLVISSATLRARSNPYRVWLELARGALDRLRNRIAGWQVQGFVLSEALQAQVRDITLAFCEAAMAATDGPRCDDLSHRVVVMTLEAMDRVVEEPGGWLRANATASGRSATLRGAWLLPPAGLAKSDDLELHAQRLEGLVNTIVVAPDWSSIEPRPNEWHWESLDAAIEVANRRSWNVVLGPFFSFRRECFPEWVLAGDDTTEIRRAVQRFVSQLMQRHASHVDLVLAVDQINRVDGLAWDGPLRLQLVIDAGATLRRSVENLPFVVGFTQPFSEDQPRGVDYPALHLADALLRANLELCGLAIDFTFGDGPGMTRPRDLFQLLERLGQWSSFGLPLVVGTNQAAPESPELEGTQVRRDFGRWLEVLDASPWVHGLFWQPGGEREMLDRQGELTANGRLFQERCPLPSPHDTSAG